MKVLMLLAALAFQDAGTLSKDASFQSRVAYAMNVAAVNVYSEAPSTVGHSARLYYALQVGRGQYNLEAASFAVLTNSTIFAEAQLGVTGNNVPDGDIQFAVNSLWNFLSGA